jgi:hypothetical protein
MFDDQIAKGVSLLNEVNPNWKKKIRVSLLNMDKKQMCILGQLYGHYDEGLRILHLNSQTSLEHGFRTKPAPPEERQILTEEWRKII